MPTDGLWEIPLWVAHLTSLLDTASIGSSFCDLSKVHAEVAECAERIHAETAHGDLVLMSPLAQNFRLALGVAEQLEAAGRRVVLGGNMAPLTPPGAVHLVHRGQLDAALVKKLTMMAVGTGAGWRSPRPADSPRSASPGPRTTVTSTATRARCHCSA